MIPWREALGATPMRQSLRLVLLFLIVASLSFLATWFLANEALLDASETALEQEIEELAVPGDPALIARLVAEGATQVDPEHQILRFDGPLGSVGNYLGPIPGGRFRQVDLSDAAAGVHGSYLILSRPIDGGVLTVGQDAEALAELREVFGKVLFLTLIPTAVMLLAGGMVIALRSTRRLAAIEATLERLRQGDLGARLPPLPGPPDDLSRVGAGIDRLAAAQEASVAALKQVSTDIAHDLRTPIQRLALLLDAGGEADLERASAEVQNISATFDALLRIAQIEGGGPDLVREPVDLGRLVRDIFDLYEPSAQETGHRLDLDIVEPAVVRGDRRLLGQALVNLVENALRHSPPGPVTIGADSTGFWVADHGPGIPAEKRQAVVRRLYRLDRSRNTPGNGLGLSLVSAIAQRHGATLDLADNTPGLRATLRFRRE